MESGFRPKGTSTLSVFVQHQGAVRQVKPGETVFPDDSLQPGFTIKEPAHIAVLSLGGDGTASVYYPENERTVEVEPQGEITYLPQSTVLDDVLGVETIFGLVCDNAMELGPIVAALQHEATLEAMEGCAVEVFKLEKAAPR